MQIFTRDRSTKRNMTPNFIIIKSASRQQIDKCSRKNINKQKSQNSNNPNKTDRSSSKNSKCSLQTYQRRILHLSKLKSNLTIKNKNSQINQPVKVISITNTLSNVQPHDDSRKFSSNSLRKDKTSINTSNIVGAGITQRRVNNNHDNSLSTKKISGSGKIIYVPHSRSNSKRDEQSLQKQQQRAKVMNVDLLSDLVKHSQTPNYIHKLKLKKNQKDTKQKKRDTNKSHLLRLNIEVKGPQSLKQLYEIHGQLGKGAYGVVKMGVHKKSGQKVAIKLYHKKHLDEMNRLKNLQREINILSELNYPVIAKLIQAIQTPTDIYLVMEYGGANSLYNYLLSKQEHRLKECQAKKFFLTIAESIAYLHSKNIVHRDIKAQNILINRYKELKLIDFGFSIHSVPPHTIDTFCGTPTYMAPEIVSKIDHIPIYTDMWSLGILYYVMLQGNYPFRSKNQQQLFQKIRKGKFEYIHPEISEESKKFIESLLKVNPYQRLTINDVLSQKYNKFFDEAQLDQNPS